MAVSELQHGHSPLVPSAWSSSRPAR